MHFGDQLAIQICQGQFLFIAGSFSSIKIFYCWVFLLHSTVMQSKSWTLNFSEFVCLINVFCLRGRLLIIGIFFIATPFLSITAIWNKTTSLIDCENIHCNKFFFFWRFWLFAQLCHAFSFGGDVKVMVWILQRRAPNNNESHTYFHIQCDYQVSSSKIYFNFMLFS